jgi:hypothetical protein
MLSNLPPGVSDNDPHINPPDAETLTCAICGEIFEPYPTMRKAATTNPHWCEPCQDEFDNIDWDVD